MASNIIANKKRTGLNLLGFITLDNDTDTEIMGLPHYETAQLAEVCRQKQVKEILIASGGMDEDAILRLIYELFPLGLPIKFRLTPSPH